jgi:hypothetical protein
VSAAAILLLALLAIELPLLAAAVSRRPRVGPAARVLLFIVPLAAAFAFRAARAFSTHAVLDWDETYYTSLAVTGAAGYGLYPHIYGFGPMPLMGGVGYAAYSYVLAVKTFGATVFALRSVSLLVSLAGIGGIWVLVRTWYGSGAAWIGAAATASLQLFVLSNTARMDAWTFAYVAWALVAVAFAFERWPRRRWHFAAGLIFAIGLQVHIDTMATAAACGLLYLLRYAAEARSARRLWIGGHPIFLYVAGLLTGGLIYVCANILPDTAAYYTMTVRVRVDATTWYSGGTSSLAGSFLNPQILFAKEAARYGQLLASMPALEIALIAAGLVAAAARRSAPDRMVLVLAPAVLVAAAVLLNNASPLYFIHVLPVLVVPIGPLFSHGLTGSSKIGVGEIRPLPLLAAVLVACALTASAGSRTIRSIRATPPPAADAAAVQQMRSLIDRRCIVAGDGALYVPYFADYPRFISLRTVEVRHGMFYHQMSDEAAYWRLKQPDAVFETGELRLALADYVVSRGFTRAGPGLWMNPAGCAGSG